VTLSGVDFSQFEVEFQAIDAGFDHSLAISTDGSVYAWGDNSRGQLGTGNTTGSLIPVKISLPSPAKSVSAGQYYSAVVLEDGTAYAWGVNSAGQLGVGSTTDSLVPLQVDAPTGVQFESVSAGSYHTLAVTIAGDVYGWGADDFGQVGNWDATPVEKYSPVPVAIPGSPEIVEVSAGHTHSLARSATGAVFAWSFNHVGQLGQDPFDLSHTFVPVEVPLPGGEQAVDISAGQDSSFAVAADGTAYSWGDNTYGQLGNPFYGMPDYTPDEVWTTDYNIEAISAGDQHTLALTNAGGVEAWGQGDFGQLGRNSLLDSQVPVPVSLPTGTIITEVSAGGSHSLALTDEGRILAWGEGSLGQLGNGATWDYVFPIQTASVYDTENLAVYFGSLDAEGTDTVVDVDARTVTTKAPKHAPGTVDVYLVPADAALTSAFGTYTYESGPVDPLGATVTVSSQTVPVGDSVGSKVTVSIVDDAGFPLVGADVRVTLSGVGTVGPVTDNGDGTYTVTVTSSAPGTATLTFGVLGTSLTVQTSVTFTATAPQPDPDNTNNPDPDNTNDPDPDSTTNPTPDNTADPDPDSSGEPKPDETGDPDGTDGLDDTDNESTDRETAEDDDELSETGVGTSLMTALAASVIFLVAGVGAFRIRGQLAHRL
jgi:alpha-tubulin suppressor-like RCC1 family protein